MNKTSQYIYRMGFSLGTILMLVILMVVIFGNVSGAHGVIVLVIYGFGLFIFLFVLALLVVKRLIPAIKGDIALALDEEGISDYIRNVSINWTDIKNIGLIPGRSASILQIDLKWESEYGEQINIPLRWVKGKDAEIYANVLSCFTANAGGP